MRIVMDGSCPLKAKADLVRVLEEEGLRVQVCERDDENLIGVAGQPTPELHERIRTMRGVLRVDLAAPPYSFVSREYRREATRISVGDLTIGGDAEVVVIAGPCAVESAEQLLRAARAVAGSGARMLRGGAFKPRTSPYSFQGLGARALDLLAKAREATGLPIVTEVLSAQDIDLVAKYADVLQVGARNMQNFRLLSALGNQPRPVLLKRGMMATLDELLMAAEYIVTAGNPRVMLCERGIRTFEPSTRNTLDLSAVPVLRQRSHLPVIVDPSHAAGAREIVPALARSAVAAGADGLIVEVHPHPERAACDGRQSLDFGAFDASMTELRLVAAAIGRHVAPPAATMGDRRKS